MNYSNCARSAKKARRPSPLRHRHAPERKRRRVYVHGEVPAGVRDTKAASKPMLLFFR